MLHLEIDWALKEAEFEEFKKSKESQDWVKMRFPSEDGGGPILVPPMLVERLLDHGYKFEEPLVNNILLKTVESEDSSINGESDFVSCEEDIETVGVGGNFKHHGIGKKSGRVFNRPWIQMFAKVSFIHVKDKEPRWCT